MASKPFEELRSLFLEYEGLSNNVEFCDELSRAGLSSEENPASLDRVRMLEIEKIVDVIIRQCEV
jgi:hypothetical protein